MYTVYKIINTINEKYYIGVHLTKNPNDSYMGSGRAIKAAIKKYRKESFKKEILLVTESKDEAYDFEKQLTQNYMLKNNYNMRLGGVGGFTRENAQKGYEAGFAKLTKQQLSENGKKGNLAARGKLNLVENGRKGGLTQKGKPKSEKHKQALRDAWIVRKLRAGSSIGRTVCS